MVSSEEDAAEEPSPSESIEVVAEEGREADLEACASERCEALAMTTGCGGVGKAMYGSPR